MYRSMLFTVALLASQGAFAATYATMCHNCSPTQVINAAMSTTDEGTVYVFDEGRGKVFKYGVGSETVDTIPPSVVRHTWWMRIEPVLDNAYRGFVAAGDNLRAMGPIVLPPDFPVRSIAGVFLDPNHATTSIEDWLASQDEYQQLIDQLNALVSKLVQLQIPLLSGPLVDQVVFTIEFPDGSTMEFTIEITMNARTGLSTIELVPYGNARTEDGRAAPEHPISYRGRTFYDHDGSLSEWISHAASLGIPIVYRGANGATMKCTIQGNTITCVVKDKPR